MSSVILRDWWLGSMDMGTVWNRGVSNGCIAKGGSQLSLNETVRRMDQQMGSCTVLLITQGKAMQCQYYRVFFQFLLPSTLNHPCLLDKCPSSSPHHVLTWTWLHTAVCSKGSLQASEGITGTGTVVVCCRYRVYTKQKSRLPALGEEAYDLWRQGTVRGVMGWKSS